MTTEIEMRRIIGSILWASGEMFVGTGVADPNEYGSESDHPSIVCKTTDGDEFQITIVQTRGG